MVYPRSLFSPPTVRLGGPPAEPAEGPPAIVEQPPRRLGRLVSDVVLAKVRHLYEGTDLTHRQIAARTGVHHVSVSRWGRHFGWQRPPHAPRASNMVPDWRAGPQLKLSKLAIRLKALAERHVRELEEAPHIDVELLMQALQVLKM